MPKSKFESKFKAIYDKHLKEIDDEKRKYSEVRLHAMVTEIFGIQRRYINELENRLKHLEEANEMLRRRTYRLRSTQDVRR